MIQVASRRAPRQTEQVTWMAETSYHNASDLNTRSMEEPAVQPATDAVRPALTSLVRLLARQAAREADSANLAAKEAEGQ